MNTKPVKNVSAIAAYAMAVSYLAACGGGGNGFTPPPPPTGDSWRRGVFQPANTFKSSCQAPRSGIDPATGGGFADRAGMLLDELNYLRSYSDNTYLWYDEIFDRNPDTFNDKLDYFDALKTNAVTSTGADKDRFHFTYDSEEWFQLSQSGVSAGYGATFSLISTTPPRQVIVAFVEPGSPADSATNGLLRGSSIEGVDGLDIDIESDAGIDALNAALFPSAAGESHIFVVRDTPSSATRRITLISASLTSDPVPLTQVLNSPAGKRVGYLLFNDHIATAELALINAVDQLNAGAGIEELIIDLRYNGGGFLTIASEMAYMVAGAAATANRTFEELQFNDKHLTINPITGQNLTPTPFASNARGAPFNGPAGLPLPTLDLDRVAVLTGPGTCSASEAIMNGLRGIGIEVIQIGSTTCGKPYGFYAQDNCGTTYFTVQFRGVNAAGFGDYVDGFSPANTGSGAGTVIPGCSVADDYTRDLGDPLEERLRVALDYLDTGTCPSPTGLAAGQLGKARAPLNATDGIIVKPQGLTNRIVLP